eukprot:gnl/TRDRNA2_/TRDRNA2_131813_c2_seq1.p3 gnl/TRDRNA2_/TRDRNA2_131813_c2~~gnl/TRDRNA2_/TRDRNA2_131813_c2_seq1.p3  ORF type:complete len:104 (+),score=6.91 gnl/TRDRNA2_/TRDRNA2_131813_c2_seq1:330-641(+)
MVLDVGDRGAERPCDEGWHLARWDAGRWTPIRWMLDASVLEPLGRLDAGHWSTGHGMLECWVLDVEMMGDKNHGAIDYQSQSVDGIPSKLGTASSHLGTATWS